jgi:hypothetical protein
MHLAHQGRERISAKDGQLAGETQRIAAFIGHDVIEFFLPSVQV